LQSRAIVAIREDGGRYIYIIFQIFHQNMWVKKGSDKEPLPFEIRRHQQVL
jgi:hypothetical protein